VWAALLALLLLTVANQTRDVVNCLANGAVILEVDDAKSRLVAHIFATTRYRLVAVSAYNSAGGTRFAFARQLAGAFYITKAGSLFRHRNTITLDDENPHGNVGATGIEFEPVGAPRMCPTAGLE